MEWRLGTTTALLLALAGGTAIAAEPLDIAPPEWRERGTGPALDPVIARIFGLSSPGYSWYSTQPDAFAAWGRSASPVDEPADYELLTVVDRLSRVRSLSLVTLMRTQSTRLFLGVSGDGLPGLHFNAQSNLIADDRHLELLRLPYLDDDESDAAAAGD